jgi:hypothetical protein
LKLNDFGFHPGSFRGSFPDLFMKISIGFFVPGRKPVISLYGTFPEKMINLSFKVGVLTFTGE